MLFCSPCPYIALGNIKSARGASAKVQKIKTGCLKGATLCKISCLNAPSEPAKPVFRAIMGKRIKDNISLALILEAVVTDVPCCAKLLQHLQLQVFSWFCLHGNPKCRQDSQPGFMIVLV